jgi:hypothetical protein
VIGAHRSDPLGNATCDFAEGSWHLQERKLGEIFAFRADFHLARGTAHGGRHGLGIGSHNKHVSPRRNNSRCIEKFGE